VTTAQLEIGDLGVAAGTVGLWLTASLLLSGREQPSPGRARVVLGCIVLAVAGLIAQIELIMALGESGWWFAQEKLVFCLPIEAITTVLAVAVATPSVLAAATSRAADPAAATLAAIQSTPSTAPTTTDGTLSTAPNATGGTLWIPRVTPVVPTALMTAAAASAAGIAARVVVGFPITPLPATVLVSLVALVSGLTYVVLARGS
jgi:hypothetical protein